MEKTIIINIGNSIIPVEESAYELLTQYLQDIKKHFSNHSDHSEIVQDIEYRIAELLNEIKDKQQKAFLNLGDVQAVIAQMGRVQDFENLESDAEAPEWNEEQHQPKKLYRDLDGRVIAGICAGISHFVNIDVRWIRVFALISVFLGGAGLLVYAILWIIMPVAHSRIERMEMKGDQTNLYGFQKNLDEELGHLKSQLNEANHAVKPLFLQLGHFIGECFELLGKSIGLIFKYFFKFVAVVVMLAGAMALIALIISFAAGLGFWSSVSNDVFFLSIFDASDKSLVLLVAFVTLAIPFLALVLFAFRVAFERKPLSKTFTFSLLIVWILGLSGTFYYVAKVSSEFKEHAEFVQTTKLNPSKSFTVAINDSMNFTAADSLRLKLDASHPNRRVINNPKENPFSSTKNVSLSFEKSENGETYVEEKYQAQGKTFQSALHNAQSTSYSFVQRDSVLTFNPRLKMDNQQWRAQSVNLKVYVPLNTRVRIPENIYRQIFLRHYYCYTHDNAEYSDWVMTEEGLKCVKELEEQAHPED